MSRISKRVRTFNFPALIALFAIVFQNIFPVLLMSPFAAPSPAIARDPGGQVFPPSVSLDGLLYSRDPSASQSWKTSNLCAGGLGCYEELSEVPFRITLSGLQIGTTYNQLQVKYDTQYSNGVIGYSSSTVGSPILDNSGISSLSVSRDSVGSCSTNVDCAIDTFTFTAEATDAVIYFDAILGEDAADWNGASLQMRLERNADGSGVGDTTIPIIVNQIERLPSMTLIKELTEPVGDADPSDWCFNVSPMTGGKTQHCIDGDGDGQTTVFLDNLQSTSYTVTESGPSGYSMVSVSGENCTQSNGSASVTVAAGTTATNATCTFVNQRDTGSLRVVKNVTGPNGEDITDASVGFGFSTDVGDGDQFELVDGGEKIYSDIPTGVYTVTEDTIPGNYEFVSYSDDSNGSLEGAQVNVTTGQQTTLTVTNRQVGAVLHVHKYTLDQIGSPSTDTSSIFTFQLNGTGDHQIKDEETETFNSLLPGLYTVLETGIPSNYEFESYTGDENQDLDGAQVSLANGQEKHVSIYNKQTLSGLLVEKVDDVDPVAAGGSFQYTITLLNEGPNVLHNLDVMDVLPTPFQLEGVSTDVGNCTPDYDADSFICDIGDLSVDQKATVTIDVDVPSDADEGTYTNNAMVYAYEYPEGVEVSEETDVEIDYDLEIKKSATVESIYAGDPTGFDYEVIVENLGPSGAHDVMISDQIPEQFTIESITDDNSEVICTEDNNLVECDIEYMDAGEVFTLTVHVTVAFDVDSTETTNTANVVSGDIDEDAEASVSIEEKTDLLVTKDDGVEQVIAGEGFTYRITVQNGPEALSDADNVVLTDTIPDVFVADSVDNAACDLTGNDLRCEWDHLDPDSEEIEINVKVYSKSSTLPDTYRNTAELVSDEDETSDYVDTPVVNQSGLFVEKTESGDEVTAGGGTFKYYLNVGNKGPSDAPDVVLSDYLPGQFNYEGYSVSSATNSFTCEVGDPLISYPDDDYLGRDALNCEIGLMEPGDEATITVTMSVPPSASPDVVINRVDVLSSNEDSDFAEEDTTVVVDVNLDVEKVDNYEEDQSAVAGRDEVEYTIVASNDGLSTAPDTILVDTLPEEFEFVSVSDTDNCKYDDVEHEVVCKYGDVGPEWEVEITITVSVPADTEPGDYTNLVILSSGDDASRDEETTNVVGKSEIDVRKRLRSSNPHVAGQDYVEFRLIYRNLGPSVVTGAYLVDDLSDILGEFESKDDIKITVTPNRGTCDPVDLDEMTLRCDFGQMGVFTDEDRIQARVDVRIDLPYYFESGRYTNLVRGYADDAEPDQARRRFDVIELSNLEIEKLVTPARVLAGSDEAYVDYQIKVKNNGPSDAEKVVVKDMLPPVFEMISKPDLCHYVLQEVLKPVTLLGAGENGVHMPMGMEMECFLPDLDPDEQEMLQFRMMVPASAEEGIYTNRAGVNSEECRPPVDVVEFTQVSDRETDEGPRPEPEMFCARSAVDVEVYEEAELRLEKSVTSQLPAKPGVDKVEFEVEVWNLGPSTTENVMVTDSLAELFNAFNYNEETLQIDITPSTGFCTSVDMNDYTFDCYLGDLGVYHEENGEGGYATIVVEFLVPSTTQPGIYTNYATAVSDECEQIDEGVCVMAEADFEILNPVDIELTKVDNYEEGEAAIAGRDEVIYTITIVNNGGPTDGLAYFVDQLPKGFYFIDVTYRETIHIPGDDPNPEIGCAYYPEDHTVRCAFSGLDSAEERVVFDIRVGVEEWVERGIHTNYANVTYGDDRSDSSEDTLVARENQLNVDKEVTSADGVQIEPDSVLIESGTKDVVFTTKIYNYGPSIATDVHFTDYISNLLGFVNEGEDLGIRVEITQGTCEDVDYDNEMIECKLGDLPPYHPVENPDPIYFYLTINIPEYVESGIYNNLVCISSSETGHDQCYPGIEDDTAVNYADREWFEILRPDPVLFITKSNSNLGQTELFEGDIVDFMLEIEVKDAPVFDLVLSDVIPEGLTYVPGSLKAEVVPKEGLNFAYPVALNASVVNGIAKVNLGNLKEGDKVIITYQAMVNSKAVPGLLKDVSWARGSDYDETIVLAQSVTGHPSALHPHIVGTEVLVGQEYESEDGEVLGTTTLASTGMSLWNVILMIGAITAGLVLLVIFAPTGLREFLQKRMTSPEVLVLPLLLFGVGVMFATPDGVSAEGLLRVYEPTSSNQNVINLGYSGASTNGPSKVTCYVKRPNGSVTSVGPFTHADFAFSSSCALSSSVFSAEGTYEMWVEGSDLDGPLTTEGSVYYTYDNTPPAAPEPVTVDDVDTCTYEVTVNVPNDDTNRVEIYRSTSPTFESNVTQLVTTLSVTPGETVVYTDTVPNCGVDYYYASRNIDSTNNASTVIAQNVVQDVVAQAPAGEVAAEQIAQQEVGADEGEVLGEEEGDEEPLPELINEEDPEPELIDEGDDAEEEQEQDEEEENWFKQYFIFFIVGIVLIMTGVIVLNNNRKKGEI